MQIALIDNLPEGGAKRVVFEQIKYLSKHHQVSYYTNTRSSIFPFEKYAQSVIRTDLEFQRYSGLLRPLQETQYFLLALKYQKIMREIKQSNHDVLLVHPCMHTQAPLALLFSHTPSLYYAEEALRIHSESELFPIVENNMFKKMYEKMRRKTIADLDFSAVKRVTGIVCNSFFTKKNIESYYQRTTDVIHPGVDTSVFFPKNKKPQYFLFIGEKEYINGYDLLEKIMKKANHKIVYVNFKSSSFKITDTELANLYRSSYATLCLARNEPFGLTAIESMACGTPVIAVNEGGHLETVTPQTGILIERSSQQLLNAMNTMASDTTLRSRFSKNGIMHIQKNFNWKKHGEALEKILLQLGNKKNHD